MELLQRIRVISIFTKTVMEAARATTNTVYRNAGLCCLSFRLIKVFTSKRFDYFCTFDPSLIPMFLDFYLR